MSKQAGMNTRLKTHINRLGLYLAPMTKTNKCDRYGNILIYFSGELGTFTIAISQFKDVNGEQLPIEDQRLHMRFQHRNEDYATVDMDIEEAKERLNGLASYMAGIPFILHNQNVCANVSLPKLKRYLFDVPYSEKDKEKFLRLFDKNNQQLIENEKTRISNKEELAEAERKYEFEFKSRSKQGEIDALKAVIERLEREEKTLKEELTRKHRITHLNNIVEADEQRSLGSYKVHMQAAADIIAEHNLSIDFSIVEQLIQNVKAGEEV